MYKYTSSTLVIQCKVLLLLFQHLKIIVASSGAVLGNESPPFTEKSVISPVSPYGASKASIEHYCKAFSYTYGLNIVTCRFSNVYGPFSMHKNTVVHNMFKTAMKNNKIYVSGSGKQTRDFLYVKDLVDALFLLSRQQQKKEYEVYNIATSKETSILELAHFLQEIFDTKMNLKAKIKFTKMLKGEVDRSFANYNLINRTTNWKPNTNLYENLSHTISWFKQNY